ncbi:unnamed protein product [Medioppia subpectinata]|uniref:V-SNARE coiled-coil homology domain-containing protein n=1 Tax=Medioppia subpectinata TaxID=1979941 RepID=A0A7R9PXS4_9ACAR|nr:unnamed protein product [Medioppia subpectinata]CAG2104327.1 unnamed protein product [Medioppia subpectinata]
MIKIKARQVSKFKIDEAAHLIVFYRLNYYGKRAQANEVVDIMKSNVNKVNERGYKLDDLSERATALQEGAGNFKTSAKRMRQHYWWQNYKLKIILASIGVYK